MTLNSGQFLRELFDAALRILTAVQGLTADGLVLAIALKGAVGISAIACDTDGIDGSEDNAGALIDAETMRRAGEMDAGAKLMDNDAYGFFAALGDLVVTGPTRTNVNDFRALLITS